jgi:hypothetical protein
VRYKILAISGKRYLKLGSKKKTKELYVQPAPLSYVNITIKIHHVVWFFIEILTPYLFISRWIFLLVFVYSCDVVIANPAIIGADDLYKRWFSRQALT